ncbi:MAG TPA: hypothetical protein VMU27_01570 [Candidatus Paceibacterota bacterium]|nr:hypothetical protein [Candidatus Paceibacterota bacterium]
MKTLLHWSLRVFGVLLVLFTGLFIFMKITAQPAQQPVMSIDPGKPDPSFQRDEVNLKIAFAKYNAGDWSVYIMNADGTEAKMLADCLQIECYPSWSPDGTKIAFQRTEDGASIYVISSDGSNLQRISQSNPSSDVRPSWSPDGTEILYNRVTNLNGKPPPITDTMLMNADGSDAHVILPANGDFNVEPRFSPDGKKIAFMSYQGHTYFQLYTMNADGTDLTQITSDPSNHGDPVWSPDGTRIIFGSDKEGGGKLNLFTINPDGSNEQQITHFLPPYEAGDASYSPDGKYIAFEVDVGGDKQSNPNVPAQVWIVRSEGSGSPWSTGAACASVGCAPRWSPT